MESNPVRLSAFKLQNPTHFRDTTCAPSLQQIIYGVMPLRTSFSLYRFETRVRSATVPGIVGAGDIGFTFHEGFRSCQNDRASAVIIAVAISVSIIDIITSQLRERPI